MRATFFCFNLALFCSILFSFPFYSANNFHIGASLITAWGLGLNEFMLLKRLEEIGSNRPLCNYHLIITRHFQSYRKSDVLRKCFDCCVPFVKYNFMNKKYDGHLKLTEDGFPNFSVDNY